MGETTTVPKPLSHEHEGEREQTVTGIATNPELVQTMYSQMRASMISVRGVEPPPGYSHEQQGMPAAPNEHEVDQLASSTSSFSMFDSDGSTQVRMVHFRDKGNDIHVRDTRQTDAGSAVVDH